MELHPHILESDTPIMALNDRQIRLARPEEKQYKLSDSGGLYLLVHNNGSKYWRLKYRINGKEKMLSIGVYPTISLSEAREVREEAKKLLASGIDPSQEKQKSKAAIKESVQNTFFNLANEWYERQFPTWTPKHAFNIKRSLEVDVFPSIGNDSIESIGVRQVQAIIESVAARGAIDTANLVLQRINAVFNYAIRTDRADNNPAIPLSGLIKAPRNISHPALPQGEIVEFYKRLNAETNIKAVTRIAMLLIIITFVRSGELRKAEWSEIDFEAKEWHIPAEKMKRRIAHTVPLSDWAIELLSELKQLSGHGSYLFPSVKTAGHHMSDGALTYVTARMGYKDIATPHGFRSMATDVLNENGFPPDIIERQLSHAERNRVRAAYHRTEYLPQRHEMMQWYSDWLKERYMQAVQLAQND